MAMYQRYVHMGSPYMREGIVATFGQSWVPLSPVLYPLSSHPNAAAV